MGRMDTSDLIALIHLVGFITGVLLYGMLAVMTWRTPRSGPSGGVGNIPVLAAVLGLIWNAGALLAFGWHGFGIGELSPWLVMVSNAALGFFAGRRGRFGDACGAARRAADRHCARSLCPEHRGRGDASDCDGQSRDDLVGRFVDVGPGYAAILVWLAVILAVEAARSVHLPRSPSPRLPHRRSI